MYQYLISRSQVEESNVMSGKVKVVEGGLISWGLWRWLIERSFVGGELDE